MVLGWQAFLACKFPHLTSNSRTNWNWKEKCYEIWTFSYNQNPSQRNSIPGGVGFAVVSGRGGFAVATGSSET